MKPVDLVADPLELTGRIVTASNATFLGQVGSTQVVYKPTAGEAPLWDFPDHTLAQRELAAYRVSELLGWNVVPTTCTRLGPFGHGMVQLWQEPDPDQQAVTLVPADQSLAPDRLPVFEGVDADGEAVALVHEDSAPLRRMAIFDVLVNNADRKGGHVLDMSDGHRFGVDHGLTFHIEPKLRTVLWGWAGQPLSSEEADALTRLRQEWTERVVPALSDLLVEAEIDAFARRYDQLLEAGRFPDPHHGLPPIPWPPF
ncbi:MAG: SCO1664 family protein [Beutenbergiaceae bacterium]